MQQRNSTNQSICTIPSISKLQLSGKHLPLSLPGWLQGCAHLPHLESQLHPGAQPHLTNLLHWAVLPATGPPNTAAVFSLGETPVPDHGQFSPDFPTLSAPRTRTFASIFRAVGPGTSMRAGWSGVKLVLRRSGSRSPMPSAAEPLRQSQPCVQLRSARPAAQRFPRHPGDPRGPYPSPQPQGRCGGNCRQPDEKLCHRSDCPEHTSAAEPAVPAPSTAGGREAPAVGTSCSANRIPGGDRADTSTTFVPPRGHAAPCPFPTVMVGMSARSGGVSQVLGCLVSGEAADERCESLVTDGASHGRWNFVSPETEHPTTNGALPRI